MQIAIDDIGQGASIFRCTIADSHNSALTHLTIEFEEKEYTKPGWREPYRVYLKRSDTEKLIKALQAML